VWLDNQPVAQIDVNGATETITYLHTDHLNTPRTGTDSNGTIVWRWEGEAFGGDVADEDPDGDGKQTVVNFRFPGQYYDAETGLHYNYFRYYDPSTGRYITSDPIGLAGGLNTYGYVGGNPINSIDPLGLRGTKELDILCDFFGICDPKDPAKRKRLCPEIDTQSCCSCCASRSLAEFAAEPGSICCEKCAKKYDLTRNGGATTACSQN